MGPPPSQIPLPLSFGQYKPTTSAGDSVDSASATIEDSCSSTASTNRRRGGRSSYRRSGKWSAAEENYARCMILHFSKGLLQLRSGETLRLYMSKKLFCDPMRITKRFAGTGALMKEISQSRQHCGTIELALAKTQLDGLEKQFLEEVKAEEEAVRSKRHGSTAVRLAVPIATESSSSSSSDSAHSVASIVNQRGSPSSTNGNPGATDTNWQNQHQPMTVPGPSSSSHTATPPLDAGGVSTLLMQLLATQSQQAMQPQAPVVQPPVVQPPAVQPPQQGLDPALLLALLGQLANSQPSPPQSVSFPGVNSNNHALLSALGSLPGLQQQPLAPPINPMAQLLQQHNPLPQTQPAANPILQNLAQLMAASAPAPTAAPQDAQLFLNFVNNCSDNQTS